MKMLPLTQRLLVAAAWAATLGLAAAGATAQELKIGYVNSERVLREAAPAKAAQSRLEGEFSKREKELSDQGARLKATAERLEKEGPTLAETERARRQRELLTSSWSVYPEAAGDTANKSLFCLLPMRWHSACDLSAA